MATSRARPGELWGGWWLDGALLAVFGALTAALAADWLHGPDLSVRDWCDAHRPDAGYSVARIVNYLGSGTTLTVIALVAAALLAWRLRSLRPLALPVVAFLLTTGIILPLKNLTNRAAPASTLPNAVEIFNNLPPGEYGESYPSGHVVVAIVWYGVLVWLLAGLAEQVRLPVPARLRTALRIAPPLIVLLTTTYLGYHWLTDGLAAICLGVVLDRLVVRIRLRWVASAGSGGSGG